MQAKHLVMAFVSSLLADEQGFNVGNNVVRHPLLLERTDPPKPTLCLHTAYPTTHTPRARTATGG